MPLGTGLSVLPHSGLGLGVERRAAGAQESAGSKVRVKFLLCKEALGSGLMKLDSGRLNPRRMQKSDS